MGGITQGVNELAASLTNPVAKTLVQVASAGGNAAYSASNGNVLGAVFDVGRGAIGLAPSTPYSEQAVTDARLAKGLSDDPEGFQGVDGFVRSDNTRRDSSGFLGVEFTRGDERVIVFAGTNPTSPRDWITDVAQAFGLPTRQYRQAIDWATSLAGEAGSVRFTGHSLGGGLATAAALATGGTANVFNAAGVHPNTIARYNTGGAVVTQYRSNFDVLRVANAVTPARVFGRTVWLGSAGVHSMAGVCRAMGC